MTSILFYKNKYVTISRNSNSFEQQKVIIYHKSTVYRNEVILLGLLSKILYFQYQEEYLIWVYGLRVMPSGRRLKVSVPKTVLILSFVKYISLIKTYRKW